MRMEVYKVYYNWFYTNDGEYYDVEEVNCENKYGIPIQIENHYAEYEGDEWFCDIFYKDGSKKRIFNLNQVFYKSSVL